VCSLDIAVHAPGPGGRPPAVASSATTAPLGARCRLWSRAPRPCCVNGSWRLQSVHSSLRMAGRWTLCIWPNKLKNTPASRQPRQQKIRRGLAPSLSLGTCHVCCAKHELQIHHVVDDGRRHRAAATAAVMLWTQVDPALDPLAASQQGPIFMLINTVPQHHAHAWGRESQY